MANEVKILLTVEGNTVKIQEVSQEITKLGQTSQAAMTGGQEAADNFAASLAKQIGIYALVSAAAYKLEQMLVGAFKAGIQAVDDFNLTTIGVAATLTDLGESGADAQKDYTRNIAYSKDMYNELELAAAKHFASGADMVNAWNILAQKGIVLRKEEIDDLGTIVDKIKLATQGQVQGIQIAQELRAMLSGQARATDQLAMMIKDRYGAAWKEVLEQHRQAGDLVHWLAQEFKGLIYASEDVQKTLTSQKTTLDTLLRQVGRGGLGGLYEDIVDSVFSINEYLREHKDDLIVGIAQGWATVKWTVGKVKDSLSWVIDHTPAIQAAIAAGKYGQAAQATPPEDRTFGQQAMVTFKDAAWAAPGDLIDKTTSGISTAWDFASKGVQGWMMVIQEAYVAADRLDAIHYREMQKTADFLGNSAFWKWAIDADGPIRDIKFVEDKIQGVIDLISRPYEFVINAVVSGLPSWLGGAGGFVGPPAPPLADKVTFPDKSLAAAQEAARLKATGKTQIMTPDFGLLELPNWLAESSGPPKTRPLGGAGEKKGKGGGGRDTSESLESLILQLRQEEAKLSEGAFAGVDAWYTKVAEKIKKLAMDDQQLKDGMLAASELKAAKEQKISDDNNKWFLGQMHQTTALQMTEDQKKLDSVKGHAKEEAQIREVMTQHAAERAEKLALAENQQQKTYYDALAQSSILIRDQVAWKEQSWQLEKKISQAQLEQWFIGKDLTTADKDNYRGILALTNAAKDYNQQRQKAVDLGTLEGWAIERAGEALKREKSSIKDLLTGAESFFTDAFGQGIQGALSGQNKSFKDAGKTIVQSMVLELNKKSFTKIWDDVAKLIAGAAKGTTGTAGAAKGIAGMPGAAKGASVGAGDDPAAELSGAAQLLSLSGVQLGLSAGGLLLSGIGIATNSQALVYAGAILQVAALAIQLYEMLTATTTTTEFTIAATALTGSAVALEFAADCIIMAAAADAIPFFHSGGMVAHAGLLVAHDGLNLDERLIKAQVGEWIINRDTTAQYARQGISFDMLNNGRLPVAALPVPFSGGNSRGAASERFQAEIPVHLTVVSPEGKVLSRRMERQVITLVRKYQKVGEL